MLLAPAINVIQETYSSAIDAKPMDTILSALDGNMDTTVAIKQALGDQCQIIGHVLICSECQYGHKGSYQTRSYYRTCFL